MSERSHTGKVKFFNQKNGFGFVIDDATGSEYYVNVKDCNSTLEEGDKVAFDLTQAKKGTKATNVSALDG